MTGLGLGGGAPDDGPAATSTVPREQQPPAPQGLSGRLVEFAGALRSKGIRTGTSETVDAGAIIRVLGLGDRERLRAGLACALVRCGGQRDVFDETFDLYFPAGVGAAQSVRQTAGAPTVDELRDRLAQALADHDLGELGRVAGLAVDALGPVGTPHTDSAAWSALQALEQLQPHTLLQRALEARGAAGAAGDGAAGGGATGRGPGSGGRSPGWDVDDAGEEGEFTNRLVRDEIRRDIARFRQLVASEARRRTAELRGRERMTRYAVRPATDRVDFLSANHQQLAELRATVQPLSRTLATRLAAGRRRASRGSIDIRRTLRRSMSTGGVPLAPAYRRPHPRRPELVLLCDVSGSVAGFSGFTMLLVRALADQFSKVRVFAFVNAMDEVTDLVRHGDGDLSAQILRQAHVLRWHASSDYGEALGDFAELYLDAVGPRTSVLVLGDARTNYGDPNLAALAWIAAASRRTHWLNPERTATWGWGDSVADDYARLVEMHECRTVDQLSRFVSRLLPV